MSERIYVASSWRCEQQQHVVAVLRDAGHEVYDFRNPRPGDHGFAWSAIDPEWLGAGRCSAFTAPCRGGCDPFRPCVRWRASCGRHHATRTNTTPGSQHPALSRRADRRPTLGAGSVRRTHDA